ncbi:MAG: translocation/assembly module TamB domain-containing protein [Acidobacteriaceae bacterium]|nr:translocation/assembly module TamB domain-containing protein [Acidobacteriaceae bacterium]
MTRRNRTLVTVAGALAGTVALAFIAAVVTIQTPWFAKFAGEKIIALVEDSTGGRAEIGSFQLDLWHLTVRIRNFMLHGTEPPGSDPLARIALLELRLKLFSGFKKAVDLQYLGIDHPQVNLVLLPDGSTNIPQPKIPKQPSQTPALQTVVDLAVNRFQLENGIFKVVGRKTAISAEGENLRALLNYNILKPSYVGNIAIDPLIIASGGKPPLNLHVNVPVTLERDAIRIAGAKLDSGRSHVTLSGSLDNVNAPVIAARLNANLFLPELQKSLALAMDTNTTGAPKQLTVELSLGMNQKTDTIAIQSAHLALGGTTLQASGDLSPNTQRAVRFNANLALSELSQLMNLSTVKVNGDLRANGAVTLDNDRAYAVNGTMSSGALSIRSGTTQIRNVTINSPFHADPYLISLDGLKVGALGGSLAAKIFLEKMQDLSVEVNLRNFSIPVLAAAATGKQLEYDGFLDGSLLARGNLNAKGATGYTAKARLTIAPGRHGVPVSGSLNANYDGRTAALNLEQSFIALPNSRLDLGGSLNKRVDIALTSHNLNDFLPVANFGSIKPEASLPVTLQSGVARFTAQVTGNTASPHITGHLEMSDFAVEQRPFHALALDLATSPSGAAVQNGSLVGRGLDTKFDGSIGLVQWSPRSSSPVSANLVLHNGEFADVADLAGGSSLKAFGTITADLHVNGTYGDPLGAIDVQVTNGSVYEQPFSNVSARVNLTPGLATLSHFEVDAAGGKISATGSLRHPADSFTTGQVQLQLNTDHVQLAAIDMLAKQNAGVAGAVQIVANVSGELRNDRNQTSINLANVTADLNARGLRVQNQDAGSLTAAARTSGKNVEYHLVSDFAGSDVKVQGRTALTKDYATNASVSIQGLSVAKALKLAGQGAIPASGQLTADARISGTLNDPNADLSFALNKAEIYQEPVDSLKGDVHYSNKLAEIRSIQLRAPAGDLELSGAFNHPANSFQTGSLQLKLSSSSIRLSRIEHVVQEKPGFGGTLRVGADLSANLRDVRGKTEFLIANLNADVAAAGLHLNKKNLGGMEFTARTTGSNVKFSLNSDIAQSRIEGSGQAKLSGDYPVNGNLSFHNVRYSNLAPVLKAQTGAPPRFDALVEGQASVNGPISNPEALTARLQLDRLDLRTNPQASVTGAPSIRAVELQNQGPIVLALKQESIAIQRFSVGGRDTSIVTTGSINLKDAKEPLALKLDANLDLGLLQDADRDFYSSGAVTMDATIRGSFAYPRANGRIELKNANVNYAAAPNGISHANGVILLSGRNASIQTLTGESGGGKIALSGFFGLVADVPNFNLRASASNVRVRYSGISATSNASIALAGNLKHSTMSGNVSIERIAYARSSDLGSLLSTASVPPSTPSAPSPLLSGMRLEVHVLTAPDIQIISAYANRLSVIANLTLRGTAVNPGVLGRVTVTDGQLVFFGNTYTVTTGTINFYDPSAISPVLNISLDTVAQGVNVTLGVTGPMDDLKLSYRSDPPLSFEQIVQLLATNTTPANPVIAAHQPSTPQQSFGQMGESALLGQAVANPVASRVQRVFGLSQLKIDPSFSGNNGQTARVTLQQKVASNITFTYITDVTQTNSQIIRVQWDLTNNLSAVGLRDYNGNVSVEFFYKFTRR